MTQQQIKAIKKLLNETDEFIKKQELFFSDEMTSEFVLEIFKIMGWV